MFFLSESGAPNLPHSWARVSLGPLEQSWSGGLFYASPRSGRKKEAQLHANGRQRLPDCYNNLHGDNIHIWNFREFHELTSIVSLIFPAKKTGAQPPKAGVKAVSPEASPRESSNTENTSLGPTPGATAHP